MENNAQLNSLKKNYFYSIIFVMIHTFTLKNGKEILYLPHMTDNLQKTLERQSYKHFKTPLF